MQSASQRDSIVLPRGRDSATSPACGIALRTRPVRPPCTTTACRWQLPDLLARFSTQTNATPVLIAVKSKQANTLSFQPDHLKRVLSYAELVGMPLLIAWKFHNLWTLFEAKHL